jgi:hypothetical protein
MDESFLDVLSVGCREGVHSRRMQGFAVAGRRKLQQQEQKPGAVIGAGQQQVLWSNVMVESLTSCGLGRKPLT